jgi:preprotein translocase subunit SecG
MEAVILVIHLLIATALVGVVLIQRSEGGGLGIGGGGGSSGGFMSARGTANLLTRTTAILAAAFMVTSLVLAVLAGSHSRPRSIIDALPAVPPPGQTAPLPGAPSAPAPTQTPSAPLR